MSANWPRNTAGLQKHAKYRAAEARMRVERAVKELLLAGTPVTFNAVAREASVSKAYLYRHPDIKDRIISLRQQNLRPVNAFNNRNPTQAQQVVILAKNNRISQLERENKYLRQLLAKVYGEKWDRLTSTP